MFIHGMALANVVGMVVSIQKKGDVDKLLSLSKRRSISVAKLFYNFPEEKQCERGYTAKMLMLDG